MNYKTIILVVLLALTMFAVYIKHTFAQTKSPIIEFRDIEISFEEPEAKLLFIGDMMMGRFVRTLMDRTNSNYPFEKLDENFFKEYNLVIANLEGPITKRFITGGTSLVFGFPPDTAQILKNKGIDVVTLANNHTMNRGEEGYNETINYLNEQGIEYLGHQMREDYKTSVLIKNINGIRIAFISLHDAERKIDREITKNLIKKANKESDYVIMLPHWGIEYQHIASNRQKELAHEWIDAGADLIIGHHPHVVQNMEIYNDKLIFYSLGNFVFDQYFSVDVQEELAVAITLKKDAIGFELIPLKSARSQSLLMDEEEKSRFLDKFKRWSGGETILNNKI